MRNSLLPILFLSAAIGHAQTLTRSNYFEIGDSALLYVKFDTAVWSIDVGMAGDDQEWDFSAVDFGHPSVSVDTLVWISPVGTPFYPTYMNADYSLANLCMVRRTEEFSPENNDHNYYFADDDSLAFLGHRAATGGTELWEDQFPDPRRDLQFPLSFGASYTDPFERTFFDMSGSDFHRMTGTHTVTVDGSGTLITPDGDVLEDVLRLNEVTEFVDSSMFGLQSYSIHRYSWWSASGKGAVISLDMYPDDPMVNVAYYLRQTNTSTSIAENAPGAELRIFPSPASAGVMISMNGEEILRSATLHDAAGRELQRITMTDQQLWMDRGSLAAGTYSIRAITMDGRIIHGRVIFE